MSSQANTEEPTPGLHGRRRHSQIFPQRSFSLGVEDLEGVQDGLLWIGTCRGPALSSRSQRLFKFNLILNVCICLHPKSVSPFSFSPNMVRKTVKLMGPGASFSISSSSSCFTFKRPGDKDEADSKGHFAADLFLID